MTAPSYVWAISGSWGNAGDAVTGLTDFLTRFYLSRGLITSAGGAGGINHSYVGYNTVGASVETMAALGATSIRFKTVTLASAGLITSIGVNLTDSGTNGVSMLYGGLYEDNAGTPRNLLAVTGGSPANDTFVLKARARWVHMPLGYYAAAGTYWLAVVNTDSSATLQIAYDTGGSDKSTLPTGGWIQDADFATITTGSKNYSIRASVLS